MIGTYEDAALALSEANNGFTDHLFSDFGSTRYVYLINGVIYKVNRFEYDVQFGNANQSEYENAHFLSDMLPDICALPKMHLFEIDGHAVLASEFIDGMQTGECSSAWTGLECEDDGACMSINLLEHLESLGWSDPAWGNAIVSNGKYYLIDVA